MRVGQLGATGLFAFLLSITFLVQHAAAQTIVSVHHIEGSVTAIQAIPFEGPNPEDFPCYGQVDTYRTPSCRRGKLQAEYYPIDGDSACDLFGPPAAALTQAKNMTVGCYGVFELFWDYLSFEYLLIK